MVGSVNRWERLRDHGWLQVTFTRIRNHTILDRKYEQTLESAIPYSQSCGDYALMYLRHTVRGKDLSDFLKRFSKHDYVENDHKVGQFL